MNQIVDYQPIDKVLADLSPVKKIEKAREKIRKTLQNSNYKLIVLDDDPTGVQTVHDIYVVTDWSKEWIKKGLSDNRNVLYILTNTRSYSAEKTKRINQEIVRNLCEVSKELQIKFSLISRSDSTLRGHYPLEINVLESELLNGADIEVSGHLLVPAFFEAHRYTIQDTHYLAESGKLVPVSSTEFSNDAVFGFSTAFLPNWIEEKTNGKISANEVLNISIEDIRSGGTDKVYEILLKAKQNAPIIVNAVSYDDLDIVSLAVLRAIDVGKHFLFRTAASWIKSFGGIESRPYLTAQDMTALDENYGGLIIVGSHTQKTTEQIEVIMDQYPIQVIEVNVPKILNERLRDTELHSVIKKLEENLLLKKDTIIYTSRKVITVEGKDDNLIISQSISSALVEIVRALEIKPRFIIAKGGITSSDIATKGLEIKHAKILGQVIAGVPVWLTGKEARFIDTPYIVFPGNVGDRDAILKVVENFR
ncbi:MULTISPECIES: four-carbon acid sugar kinase family protein [Bacillus]|uniref:four-carbon acid sugar kinase family protein n=1 Tax=Bacillus TaxID=1386 RepID=UPI0002F2B983|nr:MULTISPECIES: four-carbon acid sugar kinase family protein [Bacillus]